MQAQITSDFDADEDGWILRNDGDNVTATIVHTPTGGNPNGFISGTLGFDNYPAYFWYAPAKFLGDLTYQSYGQILSFSQQQAVVGDNNEYNGNYYELYSEDIYIASGNNRIYYHLPKPLIAPDWSTYSINLDASSPWRTGTASNSPLATAAQIKAALMNVTEFRIRGNYSNTANTVSLDEVSIGQRVLATPLTISNISTLSGTPGSTITITGSNFGATSTDNAVYFGSMEASISSASSTSISSTVPLGATYGKITIINKASGAVIQSKQPFNPTFDGGGRIIPASFKSKIDITLDATAGNDIRGLAVADIDGDGWNDILVAESSINSVSIFRNLGTGGELATTSFAPKMTLSGAGNGSGLRIIDLDGDGKQDIATERTTSSPTQFATFRNTSTAGNLSFEPIELWPGIVYSGSLSALEDVDGDGKFDLIGQHGSGSGSPDFWIAQNISSPGNIEFGASVSYFGGATLDAGAGVSTGDLDNDGIPEIIVKHGFGNQFQIIKNNSTPGTISLGTPFPIVQPSNGSIIIADFNLDGKNDIAWKQGYSNDDVHIRLNTNSGGALVATDFDTEIILNADLLNYGAISIGDINGDGKPDILTSDSRQIGVFENIYDGGNFTASSFIRSHVFEASGISTYPTGIIAADLNGNQKPDLVVGITNTNPVRILLYENRNVSAPVISLNTVSPLKGVVGSTVTITGNNFSTIPNENTVRFGTVEAAVLTATETELTVSVPSGASISLVSVTCNNLTSRYHLPFVPTFGPGVLFDNTHFSAPTSFTLTTADYDIAVGDLNNDGKPDVLAEGQTQRAYSFLNTHISGPITAASLVANDTTSSSAQNPILIDLDEDGLLDIMSVSGAFRNISSIGKINFAPLTNASAGSNHSFGDFNLDGKTDVLGANGTNIAIIENRSPQPGPFVTGSYPTLSSSFNYSKPATGGGTASADFDNDGWKDFVATNPGTDNVTVWRNNGEFRISTTEFTALPVITVGDNPGRIYEGDMDVDGKMDLVIYYSNTTTSQFITVLHNQSTPGNIDFNRVDYAIGATATVAHISDLDGDGKPEILVTSETSDQFFILKNNSTPGTMDASSFGVPFSTSVNNPRGISTGDINLDGKPEIIIASAPNTLLVYENLIEGTPLPTITSFNPTSGPIGTSVTIIGTNFRDISDDNIVMFNGAEAEVTASATTSITAIVPFGGTTGPITVTVDGNTATSDTDFIVTTTLVLMDDILVQDCEVQFTDSGGLLDYGSNENYTLTFLPVISTDKIKISFLSFSTESCCDKLYVYDGPDATFPLVATLFGTISPSDITATGAGGELTFVFISDGDVEEFGWEALVSCEPSSPTATITISTQPSDLTVCEEEDAIVTVSATGTTNITYQWQLFDGSVYNDVVDGSGYSGATTSTLIVNTVGDFGSGAYQCRISGDAAADVFTNSITLGINALPSTPTTTGATGCAGESITLTASGSLDGNYRWYNVATGGSPLSGEVNSSFLTPILSNSTTYYVALSDGNCESTRAPVTAFINTPPSKPNITNSGSLTICEGNSIVLTAPLATSYLWSNGEVTQEITVNVADSYSLVITDANGCESLPSDPLVITIQDCSTNQPPTINATPLTTFIGGIIRLDLTTIISDPDNNIDFTTLNITSPPSSGASSIIENTDLILDYNGVSFSGTDHVTLEVCDLLMSCVQQELSIEVAGDVVVYNAISPNNDGLNDIFFLQYIDIIEGAKLNKITIFNRWGDEVFSIENYNNADRVFNGVSNSGKELPSGTYFYKLKFASGMPEKTGYLLLKR